MISRAVLRRPVALAIALAMGLATSGCNTFGPRAVRTSQTDYNQVLAESFTDQLLLNLVRLRYRDVPYFLDVQSLSAFYQINAFVGPSASFGEGGDIAGSISANGGFIERPTMVFAPLQGEDYVKQLLAAIPIDTVMLLPQNGWSIERVFRITVQTLDVTKPSTATDRVVVHRLPNAPSASGPTPDYPPRYRRFADFAERLRDLQVDGLLTVAPCPEPPETPETADEKDDAPTGEAACYRFEIDAITDAQRAELRQILGHLDLEQPSEGPAVLTFSSRRGGNDTTDLQLSTRSLMGILYFLSQGVVAPEEHEAQGLVTITELPDGSRYDWKEALSELFEVKSSKERPAPGTAFAAVRYRGHWFYIEDSDLESKTTFGLLAQLVSLQSGDQRVTPILTLGGD